MLSDDIYANDWMGLNWSEWTSLNPDDNQLSTIDTEPGLYRVKHKKRNGLEYIGETGRSTRGRVMALGRNTYKEQMPFRDPHTAAPCLWAVVDQYGPGLKVSTVTPELAEDKQQRKGLEETLIMLSRQKMGRSPTANFGRIIEGYSQSSYRKGGYVGGLLKEGQIEPNTQKGRGPVSWKNVESVTGINWMGISWSHPRQLKERLDHNYPNAGVYRIWRPNKESLSYIGETRSFQNRMRKHQKTFGGDALFSVASPSGMDAKHRRTEVETDLIGAHYLVNGVPPLSQF